MNDLFLKSHSYYTTTDDEVNLNTTHIVQHAYIEYLDGKRDQIEIVYCNNKMGLGDWRGGLMGSIEDFDLNDPIEAEGICPECIDKYRRKDE